MEVKLTYQAGYQAQGSSSVGNNNVEYIKIDTMFGKYELYYFIYI